ncbi:hypothetical protein GTZ93_16390 [Corallococcus exiguus]|uniref:Uncharacterized protein n=1 Tax=Corallococcus exiguus TaxID=83462 RepID=A0A7X5BQ29_9BACT|nr:hypothetical protein [Corallococcus exiguus]
MDEQVPRTTGPTLQALEERFGITAARAARVAQRRDEAGALRNAATEFQVVRRP